MKKEHAPWTILQSADDALLRYRRTPTGTIQVQTLEITDEHELTQEQLQVMLQMAKGLGTDPDTAPVSAPEPTPLFPRRTGPVALHRAPVEQSIDTESAEGFLITEDGVQVLDDEAQDSPHILSNLPF